MAVYEYSCRECGRTLERRYPMGEAPLERQSFCEESGRDTMLYRRFSPPAIRIP